MTSTVGNRITLCIVEDGISTYLEALFAITEHYFNKYKSSVYSL